MPKIYPGPELFSAKVPKNGKNARLKCIPGPRLRESNKSPATVRVVPAVRKILNLVQNTIGRIYGLRMTG